MTERYFLKEIVTGTFLIGAVLLAAAGTVQAIDYDFQSAQKTLQERQIAESQVQARVDTRRTQRDLSQRELDSVASQVNQTNNDLDKTFRESDQARSEQSKARSEQEQRRLELNRLQDEHRELSSTIARDQHQLAALQSDKSDLESRLQRINRRISQLESEPGTGDWTCVYRDRGQEEHRGGHRSTNSNRETARAAAEAECLSVHGECRLLSCTQPEHPQLANLRQEQSEVQSRINESQNRINIVQKQIQDHSHRINNVKRSSDDVEGQILRLASRIDQLDNVIAKCERSITQLQSELNHLRIAEANAQSNLSLAQRDLANMETDLRIAKEATSRANSYYEQVRRNYNNAMSAAVSSGRSQADEHARREARERGGPVGSNEGSASGIKYGNEAGTEDAKLISKAEGYTFGVDNGSKDPNLVKAYQKGFESGKQLALRHARASAFPASYNQNMRAYFGSKPSQEILIDMADELSEIPEEVSANYLSPSLKRVSQSESPRFSAPEIPQNQPPRPNDPSINVPRSEQRYFSPKCGGHDLPEFDQACLTAYGNHFESSFSSSYREAYRETYVRAFNQSSANSYATSRSQNFAAIFRDAALLGAENEGHLNGYHQSLSTYQREQTLAGEQAFNSFIDSGYLAKLEQVRLLESVDDGNWSPNEQVTLEATLLNYGAKFSATDVLELRITEVNGVLMDMNIKSLPALPGKSKIILRGVLSGKLRSLIADSSKFSLTAELVVVNAKGEAEVIDEASFGGMLRQPFAIVGVEYPKSAEVGEVGEGMLVVANRTNVANDASNATLTSDSSSVAIESKDLEIPSIPGGDRLEIPFSFRPDVTAGGNQTVSLTLSAEDLAGSKVELRTHTVVPVVRQGSLKVCVPNCNATSSSYTVRAGSEVWFPIQFTYEASVADRGPFIIRKTGVSDGRIGAANRSTVSVNLGSQGPRNSPYSTRFGYRFPAELAGTKQWIQVSLLRGNKEIHRLRIPVQVN